MVKDRNAAAQILMDHGWTFAEVERAIGKLTCEWPLYAVHETKVLKPIIIEEQFSHHPGPSPVWY